MTHVEHASVPRTTTVAHKLDAVAWGLFFIWVGTVLLAGIGWGLGLLGVGVITLATQGTRRHFELPVEGLRIVVGLLFVLGGVWDLLGIRLSLVPIVLIVAGAAVLFSTLRRSNP